MHPTPSHLVVLIGTNPFESTAVAKVEPAGKVCDDTMPEFAACQAQDVPNDWKNAIATSHKILEHDLGEGMMLLVARVLLPTLPCAGRQEEGVFFKYQVLNRTNMPMFVCKPLDLTMLRNKCYSSLLFMITILLDLLRTYHGNL